MLGGVDALKLEAQHELVTLLQHTLANSKSVGGCSSASPPPLLLVCASSETSPVLLSLGYLRRPLRGSLEPIPHRQLRRLLSPLGFTILSPVTGGGKSFAVRAAAAAESRRYVHVPLHSAEHGPLLARVRHGLAGGPSDESVLIHLDLSTGVQSQVSSAQMNIAT